MPILHITVAKCAKCGVERKIKDTQKLPNHWPDLLNNVILCPKCVLGYREMKQKIQQITDDYWGGE